MRIALFVLAAFSALGIAGLGVVYAAYQNYRSQLPSAGTLAAMEPALDTHVYARDGKTLLAVLHNPDFRHLHIAVNDVSRWVKLATVDVEDKHFYENASWDLPRIVKAAYDNLRHNANAGGASTITEQLAKISFLSPERSLDRKIKQVILGAEIESNFSKSQILEMYLNRIAYGNHAIGIETAAQLYFQKSAHDLDLAEAAMLVGLPNSPTLYNPLNHDAGVDVNPLAKQRQKVVLDAMVANGDITRAQATDAYAEKLTYHRFDEGDQTPYPNFMDFLTRWLDTNYGDAYRKPGGWDIVSTIDPGKQKLAEDAVKAGVLANQAKYNIHDGALVSIDPKTGEVLALVGTWDVADKVVSDRNLALEPRQPGSTIKLFTYTSAIASRQFTMTTPIQDSPVTLSVGGGKTYSPLNYDRSWHGTCQLQQCLANSYNVPAVKVEAKVGIPMITDLEINAGLKSLALPNNRPWATLYAATLGGIPNGISPLELADGVATIANLGVQHDATPVLKITEHGSSKVVFAHDPLTSGRRVVPENVAYIMSAITSNDRNRASAFGAGSDLTLKDHRVSAKTGTTENFSSNWTVGWTPDLVSVVFVGNPAQSCLKASDNAAMATIIAQRHLSIDLSSYTFSAADLKSYGLQPLNSECGPLTNSTGITGAAPIWHSYMTSALAGIPNHWYAKPADLLTQGSGDFANYFIPGTDASCYYYAPSPDAGNACTYSGTTPPPPPPTPAASPAPGAPASPTANASPTPKPSPSH
ncbi:MAG TPA: transglycosylase domain-containing protein [Candidatus Dormibacteraeota bacterium]|nr:transglycosylase domain-containing protein [Candidatus Dormibacteraeota bacterium]